MSLRDDLLLGFSKGRLNPMGTKLAKRVKECVRMRSTQRANETISIGASKLGGLQDLSPGLAWPKWKAGYLTFVAQVNLAELPATELLPNVGRLPAACLALMRAMTASPLKRPPIDPS